ncbi:MAG: ribosome small subunit-dependent GTPase A [Candidatus Aenigmatarchaeota archaeon]
MKEKIELEDIGWNDFFKEQYALYKKNSKNYDKNSKAPDDVSHDTDDIPGRIIQVLSKSYIALTEFGEMSVKVSGKFRFDSIGRSAYPVVGDWVVMNKNGVIQMVFPRKSKFSRKVAGKTTKEQVMVANVDIVWIVSGLDSDFNIQRVERYLTLVSESGAKPVILLNKSDLCKDFDAKIKVIKKIASSVPIHSMSAELNTGLDVLNQYLKKGKTIAILGSSGVGKSTIINKLLGSERQRVGAVKQDGQGRHITTHREMIIFPTGGMIIDNPGIEEVQLWSEGRGVNDVFEDIDSLAQKCKFRNCNHMSEPGCAIKEALDNGELDSRRYEHYLKLRKETNRLLFRQEQLAKKRHGSKN